MKMSALPSRNPTQSSYPEELLLLERKLTFVSATGTALDHTVNVRRGASCQNGCICVKAVLTEDANLRVSWGNLSLFRTMATIAFLDSMVRPMVVC